jgi:hypothetical protein
MPWEPQLRAWLHEVLFEMSILVEEQEADSHSAGAEELPARFDTQPDPLPEDLRSEMDTLRLCIKYIVFDNQATRRENRYLRQVIWQDREQDGET